MPLARPCCTHQTTQPHGVRVTPWKTPHRAESNRMQNGRDNPGESPMPTWQSEAQKERGRRHSEESAQAGRPPRVPPPKSSRSAAAASWTPACRPPWSWPASPCPRTGSPGAERRAPGLHARCTRQQGASSRRRDKTWPGLRAKSTHPAPAGLPTLPRLGATTSPEPRAPGSSADPRYDRPNSRMTKETRKVALST